jgi:hypothetical protein
MSETPAPPVFTSAPQRTIDHLPEIHRALRVCEPPLLPGSDPAKRLKEITDALAAVRALLNPTGWTDKEIEWQRRSADPENCFSQRGRHPAGRSPDIENAVWPEEVAAALALVFRGTCPGMAEELDQNRAERARQLTIIRSAIRDIERACTELRTGMSARPPSVQSCDPSATNSAPAWICDLFGQKQQRLLLKLRGAA